MKLFAFFLGSALAQPLDQHPGEDGFMVPKSTRGTKNSCTATCIGETDDWASYSSNGVTTEGNPSILEPWKSA